MTNAVVVVGSLHYDIMIEAPDRPRKGETVTGQVWYPKFGGKGGNQAVAAAMAGAVTRFVGAVGQDGFAGLMLETLQSQGITTDYVAKVKDCGTGMSVAIIDADGDYGAVIVSGANLRINAAQFDDPALWQGAKILILQNEVTEAVNIAAARAARRHGLTVCLNAAPWRDLPQELTALIDVLVVNAIEAEDMGGLAVRDLASAEQAATMLTAQVATVIVTAGGDGVAWAVRGRGSDKRLARPVEVISTHGAGDMFIGTLCHAIAQNADLDGAISAANAAAARHISKALT
jgi:ribokinase